MDKRQLLDQLTASRVSLQRDAATVRAEWDFQQKAVRAVRSHPVKWLGGAALSGYLFAKLRGRPAPPPRKSSKKSGEAPIAPEIRKAGKLAAFIGALRLLSPILRPLAVTCLTKVVAKYATKF